MPQQQRSEITLSAELAAVEQDNALHHWHVWLSSEGRVWATSPHNTFGGCGTTVDAGTSEGIARAIAVVEHAWQLAA